MKTESTVTDLTGSPDERMTQLQNLPRDAQSSEWLRRQLDAALRAWANEETELVIIKESRTDY
ncbi:hypothetical protein [Cryobacterium arcticum]|uniref:Uncharacterized protein n=1 Tax=Cryobacterium arcticum TaxID=670052 RepID=A0A317ZKP6_9MICO|nr:hypothetical protein [Cryobacterium arcticum]PXA67091.1 hypothetical protein CTB96_09965 [Cryobacterium arcticum]